jgi:hypothetical protein
LGPEGGQHEQRASSCLQPWYANSLAAC